MDDGAGYRRTSRPIQVAGSTRWWVLPAPLAVRALVEVHERRLALLGESIALYAS